jgi:hypothetical protein
MSYVQTVIFDCCHSGSLTRKARNDQSHLPRVRGVKMPVKIPPDLDKDIWGGRRGTSVAPGFLKSGLRSHVLLSACGAEESAKEEDGRGYFTKKLLDTLEAVGADKVTYADLIQRIPCLPAYVSYFRRDNSPLTSIVSCYEDKVRNVKVTINTVSASTRRLQYNLAVCITCVKSINTTSWTPVQYTG